MEPGKSAFTKALVRANSLDFVRWHFDAGMQHGDTLQWWDQKPRGAMHNGLDLLQYVNSSGEVLSLPPGTRVPLVYGGEFMNAIGDFLGQSVIFGHGTEDGLHLISVYGHVDPMRGLLGRMKEGSTIAVISDPGKKTVPPHLHLSLFLLPEGFPATEINWDYLGNSPDVRSLDPLEFI